MKLKNLNLTENQETTEIVDFPELQELSDFAAKMADPNNVLLSAFAPITHEEVEITVGGATIKVKKTISYELILDMIQWTVNKIVDENGFISYPVYSITKDLAIMKFFTNIELNELDDALLQVKVYSIYNILALNGVISEVRNTIDKTQLDFYENTTQQTIESILNYRNSAAGVIEAVNLKGSEQSKDIQEAFATLEDKEKFEKIAHMLETVRP